MIPLIASNMHALSIGLYHMREFVRYQATSQYNKVWQQACQTALDIHQMTFDKHVGEAWHDLVHMSVWMTPVPLPAIWQNYMMGHETFVRTLPAYMTHYDNPEMDVMVKSIKVSRELANL